ncbi:MAG: assimilatory sulfite reductase (NADPH) flavoprotein subunit [Tahibacter sp.]
MSASAAPLTAPLSDDKVGLLTRLTDGLDSPALWWLSGYAAALATHPNASRVPLPGPAREASASQRLTIVYGSQTGNSKRLAEQLAGRAESAGLAVRLLRADAYPIRELAAERLLYVVISTQGDGDPPDDARAFVEYIAGKRAPQLSELKFAILGLGDSSYPQFSAIARNLDARLAALGASRLFERADADLDIDSVATPWLDQALQAARETIKSTVARSSVTALRPLPAAIAWSRARPYAAEVLANQRITARDSSRDVRHVEISLAGSALSYEPGDALGVWPHNPAPLVDAVLAQLGLDGNSHVQHATTSQPLRLWLSEQRELTRLSRPFIATHAALAGNAELNRLLSPDHSGHLAKLLADYQIIDLLRAYPAAWSAEELVAALRPLAPRLYSIASSQKLVGDEVHLTVAHVHYEAFGCAHWGTASDFLARQSESHRIPVYIERNERFHLPKDPSRDVIMIGPGTGVAPFRGFVQERTAVGGSGRNWLFFGNPHQRQDFLYQTEWQAALKSGALNRLDLAFSRDQLQKVYVQQRIAENGAAVYDWIEKGAQVYVCGDATRMAKDVHAALVDVAMNHGGKPRDDAEAWINALQQQGRYARDVY